MDAENEGLCKAVNAYNAYLRKALQAGKYEYLAEFNAIDQGQLLVKMLELASETLPQGSGPADH